MTDYDNKDLAARIDDLTHTQTAIDLWKEKCPNAQTVVYCVTSEHASHVAQMFNDQIEGKIFDCAYCMAGVSSKNRNKSAAWFNKKLLTIITFVREPKYIEYAGVKCVLDLRPKSRQMVITLPDGDKQFWTWGIEIESDRPKMLAWLPNNLSEVAK